MEVNYQCIFNIISFLFGGIVSSFLIAKFVVNKKVEKEMKCLRDEINILKKQKENLKKNISWVFDNYYYHGERNQSKEFTAGWIKGITQAREDIIRRINQGIETGDIFNNVWSKGDKND